MNKKTIICDGDSWTFGSEICDPQIIATHSKKKHITEYDYLESNDAYRRERIWPTYLGELMDANVVNLAFPADDNKTISTRIMSYLTTQYLVPGKSTKDVLVIVGWSSPERTSFWYDDGKTSMRFRLWPNIAFFQAAGQKDFWKAYVAYMWNRDEYMAGYVRDVLNLQNFCKANDIPWMCFNAFYQTPQKNIDSWEDLSVKDELELMMHDSCQLSVSGDPGRQRARYDYTAMWSMVDNARFYKKDQPNNTFKSLIGDKLSGWHPSPEGHRVWAEELSQYIKEHNLLDGK